MGGGRCDETLKMSAWEATRLSHGNALKHSEKGVEPISDFTPIGGRVLKHNCCSTNNLFVS